MMGEMGGKGEEQRFRGEGLRIGYSRIYTVSQGLLPWSHDGWLYFQSGG